MADCGSFSKEIIEYVNGICEHFYIRANNCRSRRTEFMEHTDKTETEVRGMPCGVTSLKFDSFLADNGFRLVLCGIEIYYNTRRDAEATANARKHLISLSLTKSLRLSAIRGRQAWPSCEMQLASRTGSGMMPEANKVTNIR